MLELSKAEIVIAWVCCLLAAGILLQTPYFKFTGAPESVSIFTKVGMEPWGRLGSGVAELIAAVLLFVPELTWQGAGMSLAIMGGAILSHLSVLDVEVQGDRGLLFSLAVVVAAASSVLLYLHKTQLPFVGQLLTHQEI